MLRRHTCAGTSWGPYWAAGFFSVAHRAAPAPPSGFDKCKAQRAALESYVRNKDAFGAQATSLQVQVQRELEARQRRGGGGGSGGKGGGDVLE